MRYTFASVVMALQLVDASVLPRSNVIEYSALEGVAPFNMTFAEAHLIPFEGPVTDAPADSTAELTTRAPSGNVYYCINAWWQQACTLRHMPNDVCVDLQIPWDNSISSWGPDPGVSCHLFDRRGCDEGGSKLYNVGNPGVDNLGDYGFNDKISSVRCWYW